jgi:hypothetical protein
VEPRASKRYAIDHESMRPLDRNEASYVEAHFRVLLIVNRIQMIGAAFIVLLNLAGAGIVGVLFFRRGGAEAFFGALLVLFFLAMAGLFGFAFVVRRKVDREPDPVPRAAFELAGPFWEKASARSATRHGIGDTLVSVPPHWLPLLRRAGASRVLSAEVADGPAETSILLSVNGALSVSDDVARGYLSGPGRTSLTPLLALFAFIAFVLAALIGAASYDRDLTLWRYLEVGAKSRHFSSVAELEGARPLPFGRVELAGVTLERRGGHAMVAHDEPPVALGGAAELSRELDRIGREIEQAPCADIDATCAAAEQERHAEAMAREVAKVLGDAQAWVASLAAPRQGGLLVRARDDDIAPELESARAYFRDALATLGSEADRAQRVRERVASRSEQISSLMPETPRRFDPSAMIRESARRTVFRDIESELKDLLPGAESELADTERSVAARHTLKAILFRRPSGAEWLAVDAHYDEFGLCAQAIAYVAGILLAILLPLSARQIVSGRRSYLERVAAMPRSL